MLSPLNLRPVSYFLLGFFGGLVFFRLAVLEGLQEVGRCISVSSYNWGLYNCNWLEEHSTTTTIEDEIWLKERKRHLQEIYVLVGKNKQGLHVTRCKELAWSHWHRHIWYKDQNLRYRAILHMTLYLRLWSILFSKKTTTLAIIKVHVQPCKVSGKVSSLSHINESCECKTRQCKDCWGID